MRSHTMIALGATGLAAFAAVAHADPRPTLGGSFVFKGKMDGTDFSGTMKFIETSHGSYRVVATEKRDGQETVTWTGKATVVNELVKIRRDSIKGIAEKVGDANSDDKSHLEYQALFDARFRRAHVVIQKVAPINGVMRHREIGQADLETKAGLRQAGELAVFSKEKLKELMNHGLEGTGEIDLDDYVHIALGGGVRLLADDERTGYMKGADEEYRTKNQKEPIWVELTANGGTRLGRDDLSKDVAFAGDLTFQPAFGYEAGIKYTLVDQYEKGFDLAVDLAENGFRSFKLPLDAQKARAMPLGQQRTYESYATLTLSGTLEYGHNFKTLFKDYEDVKFDATTSVTWRHSSNMKLFVERQFKDYVHVTWNPSTQKDLGIAAQAVFGLIHDADKVKALGFLKRHVAEAAFAQGEGYVTIQFSVGADWIRTHDLNVDMVFDLSTPEGCQGYEAAVRGDLKTVEKLAIGGEHHPGIAHWTRTDTRSKALETSVQVDVFNLLKYNHSSETKSTHIEVESLGGSSVTDSYTHNKTNDSLFGKRHKNLSVDGTAKEVKPRKGDPSSGIRFDVTFESDDPKTNKDGVADRFALARALFGAVDLPEVDTSNKIPTQTKLEVILGGDAIKKVLASSDEAFVDAYARACWGKGYVWDTKRVKALADLDATNPQNDGVHDELLRAKEALDALDRIHKAQKAGSPKDQAHRFRDLAKADGFRMHAVVALAFLTDRSDTQVSLTIQSAGKTLFDKTEGQAKDLPEDP